MTELAACNFAILHAFFEGFYNAHGFGWIFRGQADKEWPVVPAAGRPTYATPAHRGGTPKDLGRFRAWCEVACAFATLPANEWERLAFAQHHGLATRLLDWTNNPLVATYFAVNSAPSMDGAVYCYLPASYIDENVARLGKIGQVAGYRARSVAGRIVTQGATFTYHPDPRVPLVGTLRENLSGRSDLVRITIPAINKDEIRETLDKYGVNEMRLFPDLDGLSRQVNWKTALMVAQRRSRFEAENISPPESEAGCP